jgi:hypothetical protein
MAKTHIVNFSDFSLSAVSDSYEISVLCCVRLSDTED